MLPVKNSSICFYLYEKLFLWFFNWTLVFLSLVFSLWLGGDLQGSMSRFLFTKWENFQHCFIVFKFSLCFLPETLTSSTVSNSMTLRIYSRSVPLSSSCLLISMEAFPGCLHSTFAIHSPSQKVIFSFNYRYRSFISLLRFFFLLSMYDQYVFPYGLKS